MLTDEEQRLKEQAMIDRKAQLALERRLAEEEALRIAELKRLK